MLVLVTTPKLPTRLRDPTTSKKTVSKTAEEGRPKKAAKSKPAAKAKAPKSDGNNPRNGALGAQILERIAAH